MSKLKKILIFVSSGLMIALGVLYAWFAVKNILDPIYFNETSLKIRELFNITLTADNSEKITWLIRGGISLVMSSAVIAFGFAGFAIRYALYSPQDFANRKSVLVTMAAISIVVVNPISGALFLTSALLKDNNYVPVEEIDTDMGVIEVKLTKLKELKDKDLISQEEFEKLRQDILNSTK